MVLAKGPLNQFRVFLLSFLHALGGVSWNVPLVPLATTSYGPAV